MAIEVTSVREPNRLPRIKEAAAKLREQARRTRQRTFLFRVLCVTLVIGCGSVAVTVGYFYSYYSKVVDERLASGYLTSRAGIYAAPRVLRAGQKMTREGFVEILRRAGYVEAGAGSNVWSGRFSVHADDIEVRPYRASERARSTAIEVVRVGFDRRGRIASIVGDGATLDSYTLEPEPLTNDAAMKSEQREALSYEDVPPMLAHAILAIEDRRFFEHGGLDVFGIARALVNWGEAAGGEQDLKQGGSTITQQLVKNTYLTPERTLRRKFNEAVLASVLERRLSKQDILALYCNEIYLGQRGSVAVRGVAQAARIFFGKELKDLSLAEAATIAGMIQSPGRYAPDRHPETAKVRRDTVLAAMLRDAAITPEQAKSAAAEPVTVVPLEEHNATAPYFIDYVNRAVEAQPSTTKAAGSIAPRVYTTIDLELQQLAEDAVRRQLDRLEKVYKGKRTPQAALVALDPRTGHILAMVGGNRYAESQLNRATDARRQPGSVFKPVVYAAAIEGGISPASMALDAPREFLYDRRAKYRPANYGGGYSMRDVTLRDALVRSLNVVTVDVAMRAGLSRVALLAEELGLPRPAAYPSLALGTTEATPLEVATAYAAFANGGQAVQPTAITRFDDAERPAHLEGHFQVGRQVLRPSTSYMLTDMLTGVISEGTARAARGALKGTAVAGKTGTSRDGWFAGYTPNLVCVVWVGFDDNSQLGLTGAESALPVWQEFVKGAVELRPELGGEMFERPAGVVTIEIDPETGALASSSCPERERIAVTHALAPGYECLKHGQLSETLATLDSDESYDRQAATVTTDGVARPQPGSYTPEVSPALRAAGSVAASETSVARTTRMETNAGGRSLLTNDLQVRDGARNR